MLTISITTEQKQERVIETPCAFKGVSAIYILTDERLIKFYSDGSIFITDTKNPFFQTNVSEAIKWEPIDLAQAIHDFRTTVASLKLLIPTTENV